MSSVLKVGIAQISGEPYAVEENRSRCEDALGRAFGDGADLVVLPEMIVSGYGTDADRLLAIAEPVPGAHHPKMGRDRQSGRRIHSGRSLRARQRTVIQYGGSGRARWRDRSLPQNPPVL